MMRRFVALGVQSIALVCILASPSPSVEAQGEDRALFERWARIAEPLPGAPASIGSYSAGCLQGAVTLPPDGSGYAVMRPSRHRFYGHPTLIAYLTRLAGRMQRENRNLLLFGDLGQPPGGPMLTGHASHQTGLDADVWFTTLPRRPTDAERERLRPASFVIGRKTLKSSWGPEQAAMLAAAADSADVNRIFVSPPIKRYMCRQYRRPRGSIGCVRGGGMKITSTSGSSARRAARCAESSRGSIRRTTAAPMNWPGGSRARRTANGPGCRRRPSLAVSPSCPPSAPRRTDALEGAFARQVVARKNRRQHGEVDVEFFARYCIALTSFGCPKGEGLATTGRRSHTGHSVDALPRLVRLSLCAVSRSSRCDAFRHRASLREFHSPGHLPFTSSGTRDSPSPRLRNVSTRPAVALLKQPNRVLHRGGTQMHVPLRRHQLLMSGQFLNRAWRCTGRHQVRAERVAQSVCATLRKVGRSTGLPHVLTDDPLCDRETVGQASTLLLSDDDWATQSVTLSCLASAGGYPSADFQLRSLPIHDLCSDCMRGRGDRARTSRKGSVSSEADAVESLPPRARLADASDKHERAERQEVGRSHPCTRRAEWQHLGLSSLLQRQAHRRRDLLESRRRQPADS